MKVFLSWSEEPSGAYAKVFCNWLPNVLENVQTFFLA